MSEGEREQREDDESRDEGEERDGQGSSGDGSSGESGSSGDDESRSQDDSGGEDDKDDDSGDKGKERSRDDKGDREELEREGETEGKSEREPDRDEDEGGDEDSKDKDGEDEEREPPGAVKSVLLFVGVVVFVLLGFLLFSALIAPTYAVALIVAAAWFLLAGFLLSRLGRRKPHLRGVLYSGLLLVVMVLAVVLLYTTFSGKTVDEQVVTGTKRSEARQTQPPPTAGSRKPPGQNIVDFAGKFESAGAGGATGDAAVVTLADGKQKLTITKLDITNGPSLSVYLAPKNEDMKHAVKLGKLKGNKGSQQYDIRPNTDIAALPRVVIYSGILSVPFARAKLKAQ